MQVKSSSDLKEIELRSKGHFQVLALFINKDEVQADIMASHDHTVTEALGSMHRCDCCPLGRPAETRARSSDSGCAVTSHL